ncbi:MAG: DUF2791 family P-loop domain-containing protein, partial [Gammaproteobacteria bacterium]|nr:DUF2791 family P-loop domain-containing protein [Gammaproteobacteria bacterium]
MSEMKLLVVDSDTKRAEQLCSILQFLGDHQTSVSDFGQWSGADEFDGLFVHAAGIETELARIAQNEMQPPIFCFGEVDSTPPAPVLGAIAENPGYAELMSALHRMEVVHSSRHGAVANAKLKQVLVGNSPAIREVRQQIEQVANSEANVLILGESGTGKEVVASSLHYLSKRQDRHFVPVNCGAIPGELLESELFGHE